MTAREAYKQASKRLTAAGSDDAFRVAGLLLEQALNVTRERFPEALSEEMPEDTLERYRAAVSRAAMGEPAQYILGNWDFYGRTYKTDKRALIPRPETELLAEAALAAVPQGENLRVMDAGTGTGCIGITLKLERPALMVTLCDVSRDALGLARENAQALGADVELIEADMRKPFPGAPYDIIVSNPPYVSGEEMERLPVVVREHEPRSALFGGADGLDFVRALAQRTGDSLAPGGRLFVEIGYGQAEKAIEIFRNVGLEAHARPDYAGIPRVLTVRKGY